MQASEFTDDRFQDDFTTTNERYVLAEYNTRTFLTELQKAFNLPPSKIFKVCKPSTKCCEVGLSKLKIRMNLENETLVFFSERRHDFWNRSSSIIFLLCN